LQSELAHPKPIASRLATGYGALRVLATFQGVWAGVEHVHSAAATVIPKLEGLIHLLTATT